MIFKQTSTISIISILALFVVYNSASAQDIGGSVSTDILLSLSPAYPGPYEKVRITAETYSFDTQTIPLSWYVNDKLVQSGKGATTITLSTGAIGTPTTIQVKASPAGATQYDRKLTIWPSGLDVLWHTNTYTPPGYRGKALPVRGSTITLVALPSFAAENGYENPKNLLYEWRVDNALQKTLSGRGKNTLSVPITRSKNAPPEVSVRVSNERKTVTQERRVEISIREPELLFYELHPLQGPLYQHALGNTFRIKPGGETRILAEPYYATSRPSALRFQWRIDSTSLASDTRHPEILSYTAEAGSTAEQTIALEIENPFYILEQLQKSFKIHVE